MKKDENKTRLPAGLTEMLNFPLIEGLLGRRSRRFALGAEMPSGPLAFKSEKEPIPLNELEQSLILLAASGTTGWHHLLMGNPCYAPHLANYSGTAGGRTFPSAAGFHTTEVFYTDDNGVYFIKNRDAPAVFDNINVENFSLEKLLEAHQNRIQKIQDTRIILPRKAPHMEGHNFWISNLPGTTLVIPVADLAQHFILILCYLLQSGFVIYDDYNKRDIPGLDHFSDIADTAHPYPLSYVDQQILMEPTVELATSCFSGCLMLQALGLGGWMYDGIDRHAVFGISGDPEAPGLHFKYQIDERWTLPNPLGLPGVFEAVCPPNLPDMRSAVEKVVNRKFSVGGPFHPETPGVWKNTPQVRSNPTVHSEQFKDCVTLQAQYVFDTFGKIPATPPSLLCTMYLQAHHLDLEFYDHYFKDGAYLHTHKNHMEAWHGVTARAKKAA
jgi:hypothetical protein